ncbi:MAG: CAP domain-containing protein, partial [Planctomycetota bacterium]
LRRLAAEIEGPRAREVVERRAAECGAAAALLDAVVGALGQGKAPGSQIRAGGTRWRVLGGGPDGVRVRNKGAERTFAWAGVPPGLFVALLEWRGDGVSRGPLGLAVAAHATGDQDLFLATLAKAYGHEPLRAELDRFVAGRVRKEALPEGGYVVAAGELLTRREHLRRQEEATIARYRAQLRASLDRIRKSAAFTRRAKMKKRKDRLDHVRRDALDLIYDTKKYFYPYRHRMTEYMPVQREVDTRVDAVRELWDDRTVLSIKGSPKLRSALDRFDEAAKELGRRLVDVSEAVDEVAFLRSYVGKKFTVRTFFRTPEERELLEYSREVMADNAEVEGDISDVERAQVRITNEYRIMFGRWPVRLLEPLVQSSRGHCEEMARIGYFGHFSPTPGRRTPYERMALEGYKYGASENCVAGTGDPMSAHVRWCHSSGHHRNLLMAEWTEMGTGHHGRLMTQNFGRAPRHAKRWKKEEVYTPGSGGDEGFDYDDDGEDDLEEDWDEEEAEGSEEESALEGGGG